MIEAVIGLVGAIVGMIVVLVLERKELDRLRQENAMLKTAIQDRKQINY